MSYIYLVYLVEILVGFLVGTVLNFYLDEAVKKKMVDSGFVLKIIL